MGILFLGHSFWKGGEIPGADGAQVHGGMSALVPSFMKNRREPVFVAGVYLYGYKPGKREKFKKGGKTPPDADL